MKKNKKLLIGIGIVVLLGIVAVGIYRNRQQSMDEGVRIGAVLPLTGDWGVFGQRMKNGIEVWLKKHPDANVKVFFEDGQGNVAKSISAFNKLVNVNKIDGCITGTSPVVLGLAPLSDKYKIFTINIGAINPKIKTLTPYMFTIVPDADVETKFLANYISRNMNRHRCYVLWRNDESGLGMLNSFSREYSLIGGEIVGNSPISSIDGIKDILVKIRDANVNTIFIPTNGDLAARIIKQAFSMGLTDIQWVGYAATEAPEVIKELKDLPNVKLTFSTFAFNVADPISDTSRSFINSYVNDYNEEPSLYSATCYDAIDLIYSAKKKHALGLKDSIEKMEAFDGVSGHLEIKGNYISTTMSVKVLEGGTFKTLE